MPKLTGNKRYRVGWTGKIILQVQYEYDDVHPNDPRLMAKRLKGWRDATVEDISGHYKAEYLYSAKIKH